MRPCKNHCLTPNLTLSLVKFPPPPPKKKCFFKPFNQIFVVTMIILPKICYKSTFLHCSNILIEIPCNLKCNFSLWRMRISQNLDLLFFAETVPNFLLLLYFLFFLLSYPRSFLLFTSFFLAGKVWTKSSVNPEKGTLTNYRCVGLFMHRFCTKKRSVFFFRSAPSDCSQHTKCMVLCCAVSVAYLKS